jgi:hypothetical protein
MIRNTDGSTYNLSGSMQQFDPENPEHNLFNQWDQELIEIGGSPIFYYEVFIQKSTVDPVYLEDRGKLFSNFPIQLWALYDPVTQQFYSTVFGADSPDELIFELNYRNVLDTIGHPPKIGSRIFTPHKQENWVILERKVSENQMWGEIRLQLVCERFQENTTTNEGTVEQPKTDFKIN